MGKRILVVDDEKPIRDLLEMVLEEDGYEVEQAEDVVEATEKLLQRKPELILLDIMLPYKNGFGLIAELKKWEIEIPVIILTASTIIHRNALAMFGGSNCMSKPFDQETLLDHIHTLIGTA